MKSSLLLQRWSEGLTSIGIKSFTLTFSLLMSLFVVNSLSASPWCWVQNGGSISAPGTCYQGQTIQISGTVPSTDSNLEYMWLWNPSADYVTSAAVELGTSYTPDFSVVMNSPGWFIRCVRPQGCGWSWSEAREASSQYVSVTTCSAIISAVTATNITSCGAHNGKLNVDPNVNGGTVLPFEIYYTYNGQEYYGGGGYNDYSNNYVTGLGAGTYSNIRIVDANGCEATHAGVYYISEDCSSAQPTCETDCSLLNTNYNNFMFLGTFNGHAYFKRTSGDVEYWTAKTYAESIGGYLVTINSQAENEWVANAAQGNYWIGLSDASNEGYFTWTNGEPVTYTNWASGEPNNYGTGEDYVEAGPNGVWNDVSDNDYNWTIVEIACPCTTPAPSCEITCPSDVNASACDTDSTEPSVTGFPTVNCGDYEFTYTDNVANTAGCGQTITRNWTATPSACESIPLVEWNMNACYSNSGNNSPYEYGELTPNYLNFGGFGSVNATGIDRNSGKHSCTYGLNNTLSTCFGMSGSSWSDNADQAIRFSVTLSPENTGFLTGLNFYELAPTQYQWVANASSTTPVQGTNNYPTLYGIRVLKDGVEVFQEINIPTTQQWTLESFDFTSNPAFEITSQTTFSFEILAYSSVGNGSDVRAWDVEDIQVLGCVNSGDLTCTQTITLEDNLTASAEVAGTLTCEQTSVQLLGSSNESNATYSWTGPSGFTSSEQNPTVSVAGSYTLTVSKGCCEATATAVQVVGNTVEPTVSLSNDGPLTCIKTDITVTVTTNDDGSFTYSWTGPNGFTSTEQAPSFTEAGTYTLEVTNPENGCTATATTTIVEDIDEPTAAASNSNPITCKDDASQLTASSTTAGATFSWTGPSGFTSTQSNPVVSVAGTYTLTVTDPSNGCTATATTTIMEDTAEPDAQAAGGEISCNTPTIELVGFSTTPNVVFSWNGPQGYAANGATANASIAGTYTLTVATVDNGCFTMTSVEVTEDTVEPTVSLTNNGPLTCDQTSVNMTATTAGGVSYLWTGPNGFTATTANAIATEAGTYTLTVTAANGCTASATTIVEGDTTQPVVTAENNGPLTCDQTSVQLTATATGAISYSWNGPDGYAANTQNPTITLPGVYTVTVMASNGCMESATTTVTEDTTPPTVDITGAGTITCDETSIDLTATGTNIASYAWSGPSGFTANTADITTTVSGDYTVIVTAANGCTATATATILEDTTDPTASITNDGPLTCDKINVTLATTTTGAVTYAWTGPGGYTSTATDPVITEPGTYTLIVTAANGCTATATTTVDQDITTPNASAQGATLTCNETSVTLTGSSTTTGVTYTWTGPGGFNSNDQSPLVNNEGTYTLTVTSANGCTATATAEVLKDDSVPEVNTTGGILTCMTTSVDLSATANVTTASYSWIGPSGFTSTEQNPTVTEAGTYTVTVTGTNGCDVERTATVTFEDDLASGIVNPTEVCAGEAATFEAVLGQAGTTYTWNFGADATPSTSTNVTEDVIWNTTGLKTVTLTVEKGVCTEEYEAVILVNEEVIALAGEDQAICQGACVQIGDVAQSGYTYLWTPSTGLNSTSVAGPVACPITTTTYTLFATKDGCTTTAEVTVSVDVELNPVADAGQPQAICFGESVQLGGNNTTTGATIMWTPTTGLDDPTSANPTAAPTTTTTYTMMVMNNGCEDQAEVTVTVEDCTFDVALNKVLATGQTELVNPGDDVTFTINVFNQGEVPANNIQVVDYIPAGLILNDADWALNGGEAVITLAETLAPGQSTSVDISFTVANNVSGQIINYAEIASATNVNTGAEGDDIDSTADSFDSNDNGGTVNTAQDDNVSDDGTTDEDDHDPEDITVQTIDLELTKVVSESVVNVGDSVTWTITLENKGPADATGVTVSDAFPPFGLTYISDNPTAGTTFDANSLIWTVGDLANGASVTLEIVTSVDFIGPYTNTAQVETADQVDIDSTPGNDDGDQSEDEEDGASVEALLIDLELVKSASVTEVLIGEEFDYTIILKNEGPSVGTNIAVTDNLPAQVEYVSSSATQGSYDAATGIWTVGDLGVNEEDTLTITVRSIAAASSLNIAEVTAADQPDIDSTPDNDDGDQSEDDEDNVSVQIGSGTFDLALNKVLANGQTELVAAGSDVTFTINVFNQGQAPANNITIVDYIPAGLTLNDADWALNGSNATITIPGTLLPGASTSIDITFTVGADATGQIINYAEIASADDANTGLPGEDLDSTPDSDDSNDTGGTVNETGQDDNVTDDGTNDEDDHDPEDIIIEQYDLALINTLADGQSANVTVGETVNFEVTVVNQGNVSSGDFTVVSQIPDGMTFVSAGQGGVYDSATNTITWDLSGLAPGDMISLDIASTADEFGVTLTNWAEIVTDSGDDEDSTPDSNIGNGPTQPNDMVDNHNDITLDEPANDEDDNDFESVTTAQGEYDLALINTFADGQSSNVAVGDTVNYVLTISNQGDLPSGDFTVLDQIPDGMTFVSAGQGGVYSNANGTITWDLSGLQPGDMITLEFAATADEFGTTLTNWAEIISDSGDDEDSTPDSNIGNGPTQPNDMVDNHNDITLDEPANDEDDNDFESVITAQGEYDLALIKTLENGQSEIVMVGDTVIFLITVANQGDLPSGDFTVADQIPTGMTFVSAGQGGTHANGLVTWDLTGLAPGATMMLEVRMTADEFGTTLNNWAEITSDSGDDSDSTPDTDTGNGPTQPNDEVTNHNEITLDDPVGDEDDNDFEAVTIAEGEYDLALINTLADGQPSNVTVGDTVDFVVTVVNQGQLPSGAYTVVSQIPDGMTFVSAGQGGVYDSATNTITWDLSGLAPGDMISLDIASTADEFGVTLTNWAEIVTDSGDDEDSTPDSNIGNGPTQPNDMVDNHNDITLDEPANDEDDNDFESVTTAQGFYDLALIKTLAEGQELFVAVGDTVDFVITIANQGDLPSGDYTVTDQLQEGLTFVNASQGGTHANGVVTWDLTGLASGDTTQLLISAIISTVGTGKYVNWAEITADSGDDEDSTPDTDTGNGFTEPNDSTTNHNDITLDNPVGDEDDNDFEDIFVDRTFNILTRIALQGAVREDAGGMNANPLMGDELRQENLIPNVEPYSGAAGVIQHFGNGGGEEAAAGIFATTGSDALVDWVVVEVRDAIDPTNIISTRSALVQRDGDVVDIDGVSPVSFSDVEEGSYHIAIRHRNHLGIMTAGTITFDGSQDIVIDFTDLATATYGENAQVDMGGYQAMWAGDLNSDGQVIFQGNANETGNVFFDVLTAPENNGAVTNYILEGYSNSDIKLNCQTIFQGANNEPTEAFFIILGHPNNTDFLSNFIINQQLPENEE